ncbi:MAG TPA: serine hydrolase domain-containing protein [Actinomycetes bacterium]|nr:serine hydrolase domain-containing protein [Actinomycetes bacterium]
MGVPAPQLRPQAVRDATAYAGSWLAYRQTYLRIPGVQAAVRHDGELVHSSAHGHADVENDVPLTPEHLFRVASHSKTFTATAVLQLVEAGALRLDDPVSRHLDWLEPPVGDVTIREMLSHSGGVIRDGEDADHWQLMRPFPDRETLHEIASTRAAIRPRNERFKYSNITYSLLGEVIEAVTGRSYHDYVSTEIVARLGLSRTGPELDPARSGEYVTGYGTLATGPQRRPIDPVDTRAMAAATGFYSTAEDLCRYLEAHCPGDERLVSDASKRLLQHAWWQVEGLPTSWYGLGFGVDQVGERRMVGHGGGFPGQITRSLLDPDDRLAVSVLTSAVDGPAEELAFGVVKLIDLAARQTGAPETDRSRFAGRFADLWGVTDVVCLDGALLMLDPTASDPTEGCFELAVEDDVTLRITTGPGYGSVGEPLRYTFAPDGSVLSVRGPNGATMWPIERYVSS